MKYVGICGLHGAGKTYIAKHLHTDTGWPLIDKRTSLRRLYNEGWFRHHEGESWESWHRSVYELVGSKPLILKVLEIVEKGGGGKIVIIDSIHAPEEWNVIHSLHPESILIGVSAPESIRRLRMDELPEMDARRIRFWHNGGACLMAEAEWAFPGILSTESLDILCREFINYVNTP